MNQQTKNQLTPGLLILAGIVTAVTFFTLNTGYETWLLYQQTAVSRPAPSSTIYDPQAQPAAVTMPQDSPPLGSLVIQEAPAVIVATGVPPKYVPSVPVVAPAPTAAPTHAPLPGTMQEAADMGYWPMPITPQQYDQCVADPGINPACQFYVGGEQ